MHTIACPRTPLRVHHDSDWGGDAIVTYSDGRGTSHSFEVNAVELAEGTFVYERTIRAPLEVVVRAVALASRAYGEHVAQRAAWA